MPPLLWIAAGLDHEHAGDEEDDRGQNDDKLTDIAETPWNGELQQYRGFADQHVNDVEDQQGCGNAETDACGW